MNIDEKVPIQTRILDVTPPPWREKASFWRRDQKLSSIFNYCVKSVQIRSYFGPYFPELRLDTGKYGPEKTLYLDTFLSRSECLRSVSCFTKNSTHKSMTSLFSLQHSCILYISKYYLEYTRPINLTFSRPVGFGFFLSKGLKI